MEGASIKSLIKDIVIKRPYFQWHILIEKICTRTQYIQAHKHGWIDTRHNVGYVGNKQEDDNNTANSEIIQYSNRFEERNKTLFVCVCVSIIFFFFLSIAQSLLCFVWPLPSAYAAHSLLLFYSINKK